MAEETVCLKVFQQPPHTLMPATCQQSHAKWLCVLPWCYTSFCFHATDSLFTALGNLQVISSPAMTSKLSNTQEQAVHVPIPVFICCRMNKMHSTNSAKVSNLKSIPCHTHSLSLALSQKNFLLAKNAFNTLNLALLNMRSLAGRSFLINNLIIQTYFDFLLLLYNLARLR